MQKLQDEKSLQHPGELHKVGLRTDAVKSQEQHSERACDLFPNGLSRKSWLLRKKEKEIMRKPCSLP